MTGSDRMLAVLDELHDLGVLLALDDFGTEHSSLSRLRELPVHVLKVDRSFLRGVPGDAAVGARSCTRSPRSAAASTCTSSPRASRPPRSRRSPPRRAAGTGRAIHLARPMPAARGHRALAATSSLAPTTPRSAERSRDHALRRRRSARSGTTPAPRRLGAHDAAVAVEGGERLRELERVDGDPVRRVALGGLRDLGREGEQLLDQLALGRLEREPVARRGERRGHALLARLAQHRRDPRVRVLDVVDGVLRDCSLASVEVEVDGRVGRAREHEEARRRRRRSRRSARSSVTKSPRRLDIDARSPPSTTCTNWSSGTTSRSGSAPSAAMIAFRRTT